MTNNRIFSQTLIVAAMLAGCSSLPTQNSLLDEARNDYRNAQANPQVASATAAAQGVLTPVPCVPVINGPWSPGSPCVQIEHQKALTDDSTCRCAWTGTIEITDAGNDVKVD